MPSIVPMQNDTPDMVALSFPPHIHSLRKVKCCHLRTMTVYPDGVFFRPKSWALLFCLSVLLFFARGPKKRFLFNVGSIRKYHTRSIFPSCSLGESTFYVGIIPNRAKRAQARDVGVLSYGTCGSVHMTVPARNTPYISRGEFILASQNEV